MVSCFQTKGDRKKTRICYYLNQGSFELVHLEGLIVKEKNNQKGYSTTNPWLTKTRTKSKNHVNKKTCPYPFKKHLTFAYIFS